MVESNEVVDENIPRIQTDINHVVSSYSFNYVEWKKMSELSAKLELDYNKRLN